MNRFFNSALRRAVTAVRNPSRLLNLLSQMTMKLRDSDWRSVNAASAREKFFLLGRLLRAYALGEYRDIPWKTMLLIVAAVIYFVNPLDLIPDLIPLTGLTDDFAVLVWVYNSVSNEIGKFEIWEKNRVRTS